MNEDLKRNIRESLVYAVRSAKDRTVRRLVISEFFHSLNRKMLLLNYETQDLIDQAYAQLEDLEAKIP